MNDQLSILRAYQVRQAPVGCPWLIEQIWTRNAVGVIGGQPKCLKTWVGLDMAVSVASNTHCFGQFRVVHPGPVLIYMAEDALPQVRQRIEGICAHRNLPMEPVDLYLIDAPCLRLDTEADQQRLVHAIERVKPRLLLLDPLVRLHRCDENSAQEMSRLLGFFREIQRSFAMAVVVTHHSSKKNRTHPGQALRGSSDLHAWTDSSAYLARKAAGILLTLEHRSQGAPPAMMIHLVTDKYDKDAHIELLPDSSLGANAPMAPSLSNAVMDLLDTTDSPMTRTQIRDSLRVKNQTLGNALVQLQACGCIRKTTKGWIPHGQESQPSRNHSSSLPGQESLPFQQET